MNQWELKANTRNRRQAKQNKNNKTRVIKSWLVWYLFWYMFGGACFLNQSQWSTNVITSGQWQQTLISTNQNSVRAFIRVKYRGMPGGNDRVWNWLIQVNRKLAWVTYFTLLKHAMDTFLDILTNRLQQEIMKLKEMMEQTRPSHV